MTPLFLHRAGNEDAGAILRLLDEAARWLNDRGIDDQWAAGEFPAGRIRNDIAAGNVVTVRDNGILLATLTIDRHADTEFWLPEDDPECALYIHRLAVRRTLAGRHIGARLLDYAAICAAARGRRYVRVDCAKRNHELHRYYKSRGFHHVRTVDLVHRRSGALFQRAVLRSGGNPVDPGGQACHDVWTWGEDRYPCRPRGMSGRAGRSSRGSSTST